MKIFTFLFLFLFPQFIFAQLSSNYASCLKSFYKLIYLENITIQDLNSVFPISEYEDSLFILEKKSNLTGDKSYLEIPRNKIVRSKNSVSYIMLEIKKYAKELTQDLPFDSLMRIIDQAIEHIEPSIFSKCIELSFPNNQKAFFDLSNETPSFINNIWLNNGDLLDDIIYGEFPVTKMKWIGMIDDKNGYVNIREKPEKDSKIVRKIFIRDIFYYTPIGDSDWWPVSIEKGGDYIGYIYKTKILNFTNLPKEIKDKFHDGY